MENNWMRINDSIINLNFVTKIDKKSIIHNKREKYLIQFTISKPENIIELEFDTENRMNEFFNDLVQKLIYNNSEVEYNEKYN